MADEVHDEVVFTMVNGQTFILKEQEGHGRTLLNETFEGWITIDEQTRIRADKVVSIQLNTGGGESGGVIY